ncbi:sodium:proton antiporter [Paenibacillus sp. N1-5-1-14]|uniref:Na+/H+ antiporter NhaC family protein n=1 Tax=Paenibacillus radicibacter TaxID=2972488 RepID=UPI002159613A|nr:Na+/H+ antiporter NhaC family protein [Paenibacillus radicibacter]MCR8641877.1 sodium:proton antiporter [Paenibacillus radicibacter]
MLTTRRLIGIVSVTVFGLLLAYTLDLPLSVGFIAGLIVLIVVTLKSGTSAIVMREAMMKGVKHTKEVVWILSLVGILIPAWTASGTIPFLIDAGLSLLNPGYFLTFAFLFSSVISMILGTSTGTLSAVGIPLMGVAASLQIPLPIVAGALISGAFVGDRTSPFSSAHRLVASSTGSTIRMQFRALLPSTILAVITCTIVYGLFDWFGKWGSQAALANVSTYASFFKYSPYLWIPLVLLLGAILLRFPTKYAFLLSTVAAMMMGSILQGVDAWQWVHTLWVGYDNTLVPFLHAKGLVDMIDLVILIALAGAFNGILEDTRMIEPYMQKLLGSSTSMVSATWRTGLFGLGLGLLSCTQTLPIMMSGRNILPLWSSKFPTQHLSRVIADTSLVFPALVPWNLLAILCMTLIGVPLESYAIYAVFLWSLPLFAIGLSCYQDYRKSKQGQVRNMEAQL